MRYFDLTPHQIVRILRRLFGKRKVPRLIIQVDVNCAVQCACVRCSRTNVSHVLAYKYITPLNKPQVALSFSGGIEAELLLYESKN